MTCVFTNRIQVAFACRAVVEIPRVNSKIRRTGFSRNNLREKSRVRCLLAAAGAVRGLQSLAFFAARSAVCLEGLKVLTGGPLGTARYQGLL